MKDEPKIHIAISLTSQTFRFSDEDSAKPSIIVKSTLITPDVLTVDSRGVRYAGTILGNPIEDLEFRVENFAWYDMETSEPVKHDLYPGSCEPYDYFVELYASQPRVTKTHLHEYNPFAEPVYLLKPDRTYRIMLKPQTVKCWVGGVDGLLARKEILPPPEGCEEVPGSENYKYPEGLELTLACDDVLILKVEE